MVIPPAICLIMMVFMPESPVLLLEKGKDEKAIEALQFYRGKDFDISADMEDIENYMNCNVGGFCNNMKQTASINGLLTLLAMHFYTRACSVGVLGFIADVLFQIGHVYGFETWSLTLIFMCAQALSTLTAVFLIERIGRRLLWLISSGIIAITATLIGVYLLVLAFHEQKGRKLESCLFWVVCLHMIGYGLGAGPLPWCMLSEYPAPGVKHFIVCLVVGVDWLSYYLFIACEKQLELTVGEGITFLIIGGFSIATFIFIWFCIIETKGQSLYEIQKSLEYQYRH